MKLFRRSYSSGSINSRQGIPEEQNRRLFILGIIVVLCFLLYILRLFLMQIVLGSHYRDRAQGIAQKTKIISARRGEIYDRNADVPLVVNTESFAVDVTPGEIPREKYDTVTLKLAQMLDVSKESIDRKIQQYGKRSFSNVEIKTDVPMEVVFNIAENSTDLPGISWRSKPLRTYVTNSYSMSHIIGYTGDITKEELKTLYNKGYKQNNVVGQTGVEKEYDKILRGTDGVQSKIVDAKGKTLVDESIIKVPDMGKNLVLTIDSRIQELAEKALGERLGAVVVLRPCNGEILAMVSYPYFNPNDFNGADGYHNFIQVRNDPRKPLYNRAINASYPPASTFKVIMTTAVLAEEAVSPLKKIECKGTMTYGTRTSKCHIYPGAHGKLDLKNGLAQSCNVYFWTVGTEYLGVEKISNYAREFGFGQLTNIDIPGQDAGFIPSASWKERRYHEKWLGGDTMNMSIGQGFTRASPLQVADMMAMVCNSGVIYNPHVVKEIRDSITNEVIEEIKPKVLYKSDIKPEVWAEVRQDLRYTITDGSARNALKNKVVKMAGKTGTGEVQGIKDSWHSWLVCYAPYDAPVEEQIVVCVLAECVEHEWEWWAPYCTNIIMQGIYANQTCEQAMKSLGLGWKMKHVGRQE
ncbi:MAG: penicillin-binding protein 2 [Treponemataceae bacterium]|nr:penicillin-binding protein 2 [Treponemataceae bacterium]